MNSIQLNFFITPNDFKEIDIFLKEQECIVIKNNLLKPEVFPGYSLNSAARDKVFQVYLSDEKFLKYISLKFLEEKNHYYVSERDSEAIQFSLGGFYPYSDTELHRSRLYYVTRYYDANNLLVSKNEEFLQWANSFLRHFKKKFLTSSKDFKSIYFSKDAKNWVSSNGARLVSGGLKFKITESDLSI